MKNIKDLLTRGVVLVKRRGVGFYTLGCNAHFDHQELVIMDDSLSAKTALEVVKNVNTLILQNGLDRLIDEKLSINTNDGVFAIILRDTGVLPTAAAFPDVSEELFNASVNPDAPIIQVDVQSINTVDGCVIPTNGVFTLESFVKPA